MKRVVRMDFIYITDNLIMKMGLVTRCELEDGSTRWCTGTGNDIGADVSSKLEMRYGVTRN